MADKDLILTAVQNYTPANLAPFFNSLFETGYDGYVGVVLYPGLNKNITFDYLNSIPNVFVLQYQNFYSTVIDRFGAYYSLLTQYPKYLAENFRYIWALDSKDIIFQINPSKYIESIGLPKLLASSEQILYKNETWGRENLASCYDNWVYELHKNNEIYNAGTIGGRAEIVKDLFMMIFAMCKSQISDNPHKNNPDQAAFNILLNTFIGDNVYFSSAESAYAAQIGTTLAKPEYSDFNIGPLPQINNDGIVTNHLGDPYCIVHQYDRINRLKKIIESKYATNT